MLVSFAVFSLVFPSATPIIWLLTLLAKISNFIVFLLSFVMPEVVWTLPCNPSVGSYSTSHSFSFLELTFSSLCVPFYSILFVVHRYNTFSDNDSNSEVLSSLWSDLHSLSSFSICFDPGLSQMSGAPKE